MKRKIGKAAAVLACIAALATGTTLFGWKAWALGVMQLSAFAVWAAIDSAEREEIIIEETATAILRLANDEDASDETI